MSNAFEINQMYLLETLIQLVRGKADRAHAYAIYTAAGVERLTPGLSVFVGEMSSVDDDDHETFPDNVTGMGYEFGYSAENFQDVVDLAVSQKPQVSDAEVIECLNYYDEHDDFLDVCA